MSHFSARWQQRYVTNKKVIPHFYLISKILKINNVTIVYNNFFSNSTSKDLLQGYSAYNSCNWKPSFRCRSECVKLDIPDNQLIINIYGWLHTIQYWYFFFFQIKGYYNTTYRKHENCVQMNKFHFYDKRLDSV